MRDAGERYDRLGWTLRAHTLPKHLFKAEAKADKRRRKERRAEEKAATTARRRVFVVDFKGDPMATRVTSLREEVTAILAVADRARRGRRPPGEPRRLRPRAGSRGVAAPARAPPRHPADRRRRHDGGQRRLPDGLRREPKIIAAPFAVVGSIGVVAQVPNFYRLLDRAGVDVEQFTGGEFKRTVTMFGRNTDDDRRKLTEEVQDTHALFKEFVAEHRPRLDLDAVGTGEHWYGARALDLGLVDELITSDDYLVAASGDADVYEVSYTPRRSVRRAVAEAVRAALPRPSTRDVGAVTSASERRARTRAEGSGVVRLGVDAGVRGRDAAQPAGLVVLERLHQLGAGVHDERPVRRDRLADRLAAEDVDVQRRRPATPAARPPSP